MDIEVESLIIQYSARTDRGEQEAEIAAQGALPLVVFANGPEHGFLLAAVPTDLEQGLASAQERQDWLPAERLAFRMRVFEAVARAIETDFASTQEPSDFANDSVILLCEALAEQGVATLSQLGPCAVRFMRDDLENPDYEAAPGA